MMLPSPARLCATLLIPAAGFGAMSAHAQTAASIPVASVAPASPGQPSDAGIVRTDAKGRRLAPHGTFYLLDYVSATTDKGVEGFEPGQEVHFVEAHRATQTLVVSDGRAQVEVAPSKLTNDLEIASMVRQKDQANQSRIAAYVQSEQAAYAKAEKEAGEATAKDLEHHRQEEVADSAVANRLQTAQPAQPVDSTAGNGGNGYYNEGGYGYGSPYSYFGNGGTTVVAAPAAAAPVASGGNKVAAPVGGGRR